MSENMLTVRDPDTYPEDIRPIVRILIESEDALSDGYGYYLGGPADVRRGLTRIANDILIATREMERGR